MKSADSIVRKKYNVEGLPIDRDAAIAKCLSEKSEKFQYGNVLILVSPQGVIHIFRDGGRVSLLEAGRQFMTDVWTKTSHRVLRAPIRQPRVKKLAEHFGWRCIQHLPLGIDIYEVRR